MTQSTNKRLAVSCKSHHGGGGGGGGKITTTLDGGSLTGLLPGKPTGGRRAGAAAGTAETPGVEESSAIVKGSTVATGAVTGAAVTTGTGTAGAGATGAAGTTGDEGVAFVGNATDNAGVRDEPIAAMVAANRMRDRLDDR
jgi:hypothetical protein